MAVNWAGSTAAVLVAVVAFTTHATTAAGDEHTPASAAAPTSEGPAPQSTPPENSTRDSTPHAGKKKKNNSTRKQESTKPEPVCTDLIAAALRNAGFGPHGTRLMWSIVMRESRGEAIGPGHWAYNGQDVGPFQYNRKAWGNTKWWDESALLDLQYSADVAWTLTRGGTWYEPWGLNADGSINAAAYPTWNDDKIYRWVEQPFRTYWDAYPC